MEKKVRKKIIIIGGGFGGCMAAKHLAKQDFEIILFDKRNHHVFQPLLYQVATAMLSPAQIAYPIRSMFRKLNNVRVLIGNVNDVNVEKRYITLKRSSQKFEYDYSNTFGKRNKTNQENKAVGTLIPQAKIDDKIISEYTNSKIFVHPTASDNLHTEGTDNNAEEWLQESASRKLQRDYFTLKLETYGDTDIMCGDMVNVQIPSNKPLPTAGSTTEVMDPLLSGRYMVTSIRHQVTPEKGIHAMTMAVMKDSLTTTTPVVEVKYKEPPKGAVKVSETVESKKLEQKTKKPSPEGPKLSAAQRNAFSSM